MLQMAVRNCLAKADELKYTSISLPAISSGIFGFPKEKCAQVMFGIALDYCAAEKTALREIRFTNFDEPTVAIFDQECRKRKAASGPLAAPPPSPGPVAPPASAPRVTAVAAAIPLEKPAPEQEKE